MKRILISLALAATSLLAQAAAPTQQSIEKLLTVSQADKILDAMKPQVGATVRMSIDQALKGRTPTAEEKKVIDDYVASAVEITKEGLTMERMKPLYIKLYAQYFTQADIDGMTAFYQSPAGKSMTSKMPQLMQGMMTAMPGVMAPMMEKLQAASQKMASDLQALHKQ